MINFHILSYSLKNGEKKEKLLYTLDSSVSISLHSVQSVKF